MPGIQTRLESVEGIHRGGRLFVRGPNVMSGYIDPARTESWSRRRTGGTTPAISWKSPNDGWVTILGRVKRFAKIGGEMISLDRRRRIWPAACGPKRATRSISLPDAKKGERLILVTDRQDADVADACSAHAQSLGAPELAAPRRIVRVTEIPLLGSGKTDYVAIKRMAET